jgi:hypothetical protein
MFSYPVPDRNRLGVRAEGGTESRRDGGTEGRREAQTCPLPSGNDSVLSTEYQVLTSDVRLLTTDY